jgi:hypothetical protein
MPINTDTDKNVGDKNKSKGLALLRDVLHKLTYTTKSLLNSQRIRRLKKQRKRTRNRSSRSLRRLKALPPSSPPPVKLSAGELTEAYSTVRFPGSNSLILFDFWFLIFHFDLWFFTLRIHFYFWFFILDYVEIAKVSNYRSNWFWFFIFDFWF